MALEQSVSPGGSPNAATETPGGSERQPQSLTAAALRRLFRKPSAMVSLAALLTLILLAIFAEVIAPYDPLEMGTGAALGAPGPGHWFGTDLFGRDLLSRTIYGGRISLMVGIAAVIISSLIGVTLGLIAGYYGGWLDMVILRAMDMILAFPGIFLALAVVSLLGTGLTNAVLAVAISTIPTYTRTVRGSILSAKELLYVDAARVMGVPDRLILVRHLLPNVIAPIIILMTLGVAWAILSISSLSFLGLGAQPPTPEWGALLYEGRGFLREAWWLTTFPGAMIMITVMAVNRLGDGLRDAFDPRLKI